MGRILFVVGFVIAMYYVNKTDAVIIKDFVMSIMNLGLFGFISVIFVILIITSIKNTK